jgi:hypothetical protein
MKLTNNNPRKYKFAAVILACAVFAQTLTGFASTTFAEEATNMTGPVLEIVTFKLADGVTEEAFLMAGEAAVTFMKNRKGFISRRLSRNNDGTYTDHVTWASLNAAKESMDASMSEASLGAFMQSIDPASMKIDHQVIVSQVN